MAVQTVAGAAICGKKKHGAFTGTGVAKGNFALSICDKAKHVGGKHQDSETGEEWNA